MESKQALEKMNKEQTLHLIVYMMFEKKITIEELNKLIIEKELQICNAVNEHLIKTLG